MLHMAETTVADRITVDPERCSGRACVRSLRLPVEHVLGLMAAGAGPDEVLETYPDLEAEDIPAVLAFTAHLAGRASGIAAE
jgi:uncharacterized protein (DUF433 family)